MNPNQPPSPPALEEPDISESNSPPEKLNIKRLIWIGLGAGAVVTGLLAIGIVPRLTRQAEINALAKAKETGVPSVNVVTPQQAELLTTLTLPGNVQAIQETTIYARTNGYLKRRLVDIGDRVRQGELLAEIDSPEVDREVEQARADLAREQAALEQARAELVRNQSSLEQARAVSAQEQADLKREQANLKLARQSWQRWQTLVQQGVVSQQDADERQATFNANQASVSSAQATVRSSQANIGTAQANIRSSQANVSAAQAQVNSNRANLQRLTVLQSFKQVAAPFTGVITARNVDAGALIIASSDSGYAGGGNNNAGNTSNNAGLYRIARTDTLRIRVNVPQVLTSSIRVGQLTEVRVRELPQQGFTGRVVRTANVLDPATNTLNTEIKMQNQNGTLRPGMYAQVIFTLTRINPPLRVPANTLVINAKGPQVASVTKNQIVKYQKVTIGRDYGTEVEILSGLGGHELLIINPTDNIRENTRVKAVPVKKE